MPISSTNRAISTSGDLDPQLWPKREGQWALEAPELRSEELRRRATNVESGQDWVSLVQPGECSDADIMDTFLSTQGSAFLGFRRDLSLEERTRIARLAREVLAGNGQTKDLRRRDGAAHALASLNLEGVAGGSDDIAAIWEAYPGIKGVEPRLEVFGERLLDDPAFGLDGLEQIAWQLMGSLEPASRLPVRIVTHPACTADLALRILELVFTRSGDLLVEKTGFELLEGATRAKRLLSNKPLVEALVRITCENHRQCFLKSGVFAALWHAPARTPAMRESLLTALGRVLPIYGVLSTESLGLESDILEEILVDGPFWDDTEEVEDLLPYAESLDGKNSSPQNLKRLEEWANGLLGKPWEKSNTTGAFRGSMVEILKRESISSKVPAWARGLKAAERDYALYQGRMAALAEVLIQKPGFVDASVATRLSQSPDAQIRAWGMLEVASRIPDESVSGEPHRDVRGWRQKA